MFSPDNKQLLPEEKKKETGLRRQWWSLSSEIKLTACVKDHGLIKA